MGLFSKKESVPDLPPAPTLPDLPKRKKKGLPELPQFPQSSKNENLNREIVKSAVSDDNTSEEEEVDSGFSPSMQDMQGANLPTLPSRTSIARGIPEPPRRLSEMREISRAVEVGGEVVGEKPKVNMVEPIFVRIDKFQSSQESFEKIVAKVKEIEGTIEKLRKVKDKEEEELEKWSSEVEQLKSRLSDIDENIFSQV